VYKVAGALAELGAPLEVVARAARAVALGCLTYGASLTVCDIPGRIPSDRLAGEAVELGLGIHGEPGATRLDTVPTTNELCSTMLARLVAALPSIQTAPPSAAAAGKVVAPTPCALLVNNYGGLSPLEQGGVVRSAVAWIDAHPTLLTLRRITAGTLVTSLAMRGFSLTLLPLNLDIGVEGGVVGGGEPVTLEALLDAPGTNAWVPCAAPPPGATSITWGGGGGGVGVGGATQTGAASPSPAVIGGG
jgi:dihydroxyacetone kinase